MSEDQLFDWEVKPKKDKQTVEVDVVPYQEPWVAITGKRGPEGWHYPQSHTEFGGVTALCGQKGRILARPSSMMVRCPTCVEEVAKGRKVADSLPFE